MADDGEKVKAYVKKRRGKQYDEKTVKALKKKPGVDNPFALATYIKKRKKSNG